MDDDKTRPIIKKVKKVHGGGHHGGSWKVAFADFMTAMFAMFLILWVVNAASPEQRAGIAEYFNDPVNFDGRSGDGAPTTETSLIDLEGGSDAIVDQGDSPVAPDRDQVLDQHIEELEDLRDEFARKIRESESLEPYQDQILLGLTRDGLEVQIIDHQDRPMFDLGSDDMRSYTREILEALADVMVEAPNAMTITGHTDSIAFTDPDEYDNWELSSDRANSARRILVESGIEQNRIKEVTGLADTMPFHEDDPTSPANRRTSIVVLNPAAARAFDDIEVDLQPVSEQEDD